MKTSIHRSLVALHLPQSAPALIVVAKTIVQAMSGQPAFLGASATLADVTAAIGDLETADAIAQTRAKGTAAAREDRRLALVVRMAELKAYVQKVADADMENGAALIQSARMSVKKTAVRPPRVFAITQGLVSGTVKVVAPKAADRAAYDWEWSKDNENTHETLESKPDRASEAEKNRPVRDHLTTTSEPVAKTGGAVSEPTVAEMERGILDAVRLGLGDVARSLSARLDARTRASAAAASNVVPFDRGRAPRR